jgi:hypothetical protein
MALDLNNSYNEAESKIQSSKTFLESKGSIKGALEKTGNQYQPSFNGSTFKLNQAEIEAKIKKQVENQIQKLINLVLSNRGAGNDSNKFLIKKFVNVIRKIQSEIIELLSSEYIKALGCDLEQTYVAGDYYFKLSTIDLFKLTQIDPELPVGKTLYEKASFDPASTPRSNNRMFRELSINEGVPYQTLFGEKYKGISNAELFDIQYIQTYTGPETDNIPNSDGWLKVTLYNRPNSQNKVSQFFVDYLQTIELINYKSLISQLMDIIFGSIQINLNYGTKTIDDNAKFNLLIQRILGLCFDEAQEISVAGQAKTPELDDTTDSFFEITNLDTSVIEQTTSQVKQQIITFESCGNIELPVNSNSMISLINELEINEVGDGTEDGLDRISNSMANNETWKKSFPFPNQLKVSMDFNFIEKMPQAVINSVLSPKHIFPYITMLRALGVEFDESKPGLSNFVKENRKLMKSLATKLGARFVEALFDEIKKEVKRMVKQVLTDITQEQLKTFYQVVERLANIAKTLSSLVNDYRKCKSVIDAILQLFNLFPSINLKIPIPILQFSDLLPGTSPDRSFINTIENMQQLGLPTGPNPDGSPNLNLIFGYSVIKGMDSETKVNGKIEATFPIFPPVPPMLKGLRITGKVR